MDGFLTVANMKLCEDVFARYMNDKFGVRIPPNDSKVRRVLWKIMNDIKARPPPAGQVQTLRQLNDLVMNIARDVVMQTGKKEVQSSSQKQNQGQGQQHHPVTIQPLAREQVLFGDRPLPVISMQPPQNSEPKRIDSGRIAQSLERLISERKGEDGAQQAPHVPGLEAVKVDKLDTNEMARMLGDMEKLRAVPAQQPVQQHQQQEFDTYFSDAVASSRPVANVGQDSAQADALAVIQPPPADAAAVFRRHMQERDDAMSAALASVADRSQPIIAQGLLQRDEHLEVAAVQRPPPSVRAVQRYISVSSFDRDWSLDPFRYSYSVSFSGYNENQGQRLFKNVRELSITRVVLPLEINDRPSLSVITAKTAAAAYINEYSFSYPYVTVRIDGIDDIYDGTNDNIRRSFCAMVFDRAFRAPNGRGYVILEPMQNEKKVFYPAPLASLRSFKVSLMKPNGAIINNSTDDFLISKFEFEDYNPTQFRVVLDRFFDKNENYVGDVVKFKGYRAYGVPDDGSYEALSAFINRPEGHEITEIGQPNENGYYRTYYIQAPGYLDKAAGRLVTDQALINALINFNAMQQSTTDPQTYDRITNGGMCNTSLQNTISFTLVHDVADHAALERYELATS